MTDRQTDIVIAYAALHYAVRPKNYYHYYDSDFMLLVVLELNLSRAEMLTPKFIHHLNSLRIYWLNNIGM